MSLLSIAFLTILIIVLVFFFALSKSEEMRDGLNNFVMKKWNKAICTFDHLGSNGNENYMESQEVGNRKVMFIFSESYDDCTVDISVENVKDGEKMPKVAAHILTDGIMEDYKIGSIFRPAPENSQETAPSSLFTDSLRPSSLFTDSLRPSGNSSAMITIRGIDLSHSSEITNKDIKLRGNKNIMGRALILVDEDSGKVIGKSIIRLGTSGI